jgi:DNA mismatch endonuclease, patch repair protein
MMRPLAMGPIMDTLTSEQRSERMGRVRSKDTKPELEVRRLVYSLGYRYRLHSSKLPGHPDLVFRKRRKVIFVHGCFWHRHDDCPRCRMPKSRLRFWKPKLNANRKRDLANQEKLAELGWDFMIVWECELGDTDELASRIHGFLGDARR